MTKNCNTHVELSEEQTKESWQNVLSEIYADMRAMATQNDRAITPKIVKANLARWMRLLKKHAPPHLKAEFEAKERLVPIC